MGEALHEVDFQQLKIENEQYLEKIDEKNTELMDLKLKASKSLQVLNSYKVSHQFIESLISFIKYISIFGKIIYGIFCLSMILITSRCFSVTISSKGDCLSCNVHVVKKQLLLNYMLKESMYN